MSLSIELKDYLQSHGATEVGFADITNFSPKEGLNSGVVFYITYPKEIIRDMENAPTLEYVLELVDLNTRLDALGMLCEEYLIDKGYDAYAQTNYSYSCGIRLDWKVSTLYNIEVWFRLKIVISLDKCPS